MTCTATTRARCRPLRRTVAGTPPDRRRARHRRARHRRFRHRRARHRRARHRRAGDYRVRQAHVRRCGGRLRYPAHPMVRVWLVRVRLVRVRPPAPTRVRPLAPAPARVRPLAQVWAGAPEASTSRYVPEIPQPVTRAFLTAARAPLTRAEPLYQDVASRHRQSPGSCLPRATGCSARRIRASRRYTAKSSARRTPTAPSTAPSRRPWPSVPTTSWNSPTPSTESILTRVQAAVGTGACQRLRGLPDLGRLLMAARHFRDGVPVLGGGPDRAAREDALTPTSTSRTPPTSPANVSGCPSGRSRPCWAWNTRPSSDMRAAAEPREKVYQMLRPADITLVIATFRRRRHRRRPGHRTRLIHRIREIRRDRTGGMPIGRTGNGGSRNGVRRTGALTGPDPGPPGPDRRGPYTNPAGGDPPDRRRGTVTTFLRRRLGPRWLRWGRDPVALVFRKAVVFSVIAALSAVLHVIGINVHLPHLRFAWPWTSISEGTTTDSERGTVGPAEDRGDLQPRLSAPRTSTSSSRTRSARTSASGHAGTAARSTRWAAHRRRSISIRAPPGGSRAPVTTCCRRSVGRSRARRARSR